MKSKKEKIIITLEGIEQEITQLEQTKNRSISKIADIFSKLQQVEGISKEQIKELLIDLINLTKKESWKFLLEIFSRFWCSQRTKMQEFFSNYVITMVGEEIEKRLDLFIESKTIQLIVTTLRESKSCELLDCKLKSVDSFCKEFGCLKAELIGYIYMLLLIATRKQYPIYETQQSIIKKIERIIFSTFAEKKVNNIYHVKSIKDSLIGGNFTDDFKQLIYLYEGLDKKIEQLENDNKIFEDTINNKLNEIKQCRESVEEIKSELLSKNQIIEEMKIQLGEYEYKIKKLEVDDEYNRNLYEQNFLSEKKKLMKRLNDELKLETEGLETVAQRLSDVDRERIERRIRRIFKILEKAEQE